MNSAKSYPHSILTLIPGSILSGNKTLCQETRRLETRYRLARSCQSLWCWVVAVSLIGDTKQPLSTLQLLSTFGAASLHRDSHVPNGHSILGWTIREQGVLGSKIQSRPLLSSLVLTECLTEDSPFSSNLDLSCFTMEFTFACTTSCLVTKHRCILPVILQSHVVSTQNYMVRKIAVKHTN